LRSAAVVAVDVRKPMAQGLDRKVVAALGGPEVWVGGSGFLVSADGLLVTSHELIQRASSVEITLEDGRRFAQVKVEAEAPQHDLALLRVEARGLPYLPLSDVEQVAVGTLAVAIGSPLGLEFHAVHGLISVTRNQAGTKFLQMRTKGAPGSAAGPLLDDRGRLLGMNATRDAGTNLSVHLLHVRDLLAAEPAPRALGPYPRAARVTSVKTNGIDAGVVDRMQVEAALRMFTVAAERCVRQVPDAAALAIRFQADRVSGMPRGAARTSSTLPAEDVTCLERAIDVFGNMLGVMLVNAYPARITRRQGVELGFVLEGLPLAAQEGATPRPLEVTIAVALPDG
jgi:hypothetical protein